MASFLGENNDNSSDSDAGFNINKDYAKKYDSWRQAEELQKREYTDLRLWMIENWLTFCFWKIG